MRLVVSESSHSSDAALQWQSAQSAHPLPPTQRPVALSENFTHREKLMRQASPFLGGTRRPPVVWRSKLQGSATSTF